MASSPFHGANNDSFASSECYEVEECCAPPEGYAHSYLENLNMQCDIEPPENELNSRINE